MSSLDEDSAETATRRRCVVGALEDLQAPVTVDRLVDELAERGERRPAGGPTWESLHERLHNEVLPALDRKGALVFDAERGLVMRRTDGAPAHGGAAPATRSNVAVQYGDRGGIERRVVRYFLSLGVGALALLGATTFDVGPFAGLPDAATAMGVAVVFSLLSLVVALLQ